MPAGQRGRGRGRGRGSGTTTRGGRTPTKRGGRKRVRIADDADPGTAATAAATGMEMRGESTAEVCTRSYFDAHRSGKQRTSNCTLADLALPTSEVLLEALRAAPDLLESNRNDAIHKATSIESMRQYLFHLHAGSNLLFYGTGSKRTVLSKITGELNKYYDVLEVCGYNPTLSARSLLGQIVDEILSIGTPVRRRTVADYANAIVDHIGNRVFALVIHNIDGPALRTTDAQRALATVAAASGVLLVASVDHVNAPLLWDGAVWAQLKWAWMPVHTFAPYDVETVYAARSMLHGARERRVEGAIMLLRSLSANARKVFAELAKSQTDDSGTERTTFNKLFEGCRSAFICTDTGSLRSILTELETHDMLDRRRGADAEEQMWIPLTADQLKSVLSQIS